MTPAVSGRRGTYQASLDLLASINCERTGIASSKSYVEPLSDARTPLADVFSILLIVISLTKRPPHHTAGGMTPPLVQETVDDKPTVLIVDDEAAPRASLTQILKQDFNILTAEDGGHALAVINDRGVDLITLDLKLPDTSGSDILKEIKRTHREIEVIMVTAYGTLQSAMDCVRHGAAGFLLMPYNAS